MKKVIKLSNQKIRNLLFSLRHYYEGILAVLIACLPAITLYGYYYLIGIESYSIDNPDTISNSYPSPDLIVVLSFSSLGFILILFLTYVNYKDEDYRDAIIFSSGIILCILLLLSGVLFFNIYSAQSFDYPLGGEDTVYEDNGKLMLQNDSLSDQTLTISVSGDSYDHNRFTTELIITSSEAQRGVVLSKVIPKEWQKSEEIRVNLITKNNSRKTISVKPRKEKFVKHEIGF